MSEDETKSDSQQIPEALQWKPTEEEKQLYTALLEFGNSHGWTKQEGELITAYILSDSTFKFSFSKALYSLEKVVQESVLSDRLLVIVSVAYLEDQIRFLLEKFLTDDEVTSELLDPNKSMIASLIPMANIAFSLGLLAKEWYETIKRIAQLRNKFAHIPSAISFDELTKIDPKASGLLESIKFRYKQFPGNDQEDTSDLKLVYQRLFLLIYELIQFSIDHVAFPEVRRPLESGQIVSVRMFMGIEKETLQHMLSKWENED